MKDGLFIFLQGAMLVAFVVASAPIVPHLWILVTGCAFAFGVARHFGHYWEIDPNSARITLPTWIIATCSAGGYVWVDVLNTLVRRTFAGSSYAGHFADLCGRGLILFAVALITFAALVGVSHASKARANVQT